jgi:transcriptional regulator with XRE-family HTH domain
MLNTLVTEKTRKIVYSKDMDLRVYSSEKLKEVRKEKKLSQVELAEKSGLSLSMVSKFEQGLFNPTTDSLAKLGQALNVYFVIGWGDINGETSILHRGHQ